MCYYRETETERMFAKEKGMIAVDEREKQVREYQVQEPDYGELIIEMVQKFHNKKLLRRIYELAEYLYLYEDGK